MEPCRNANGDAETAIRHLLAASAEAYAQKARRTSRENPRRVLYAHRAKTFGQLSRAERFVGSALQTPRSLLT